MALAFGQAFLVSLAALAFAAVVDCHRRLGGRRTGVLERYFVGRLGTRLDQFAGSHRLRYRWQRPCVTGDPGVRVRFRVRRKGGSLRQLFLRIGVKGGLVVASDDVSGFVLAVEGAACDRGVGQAHLG